MNVLYITVIILLGISCKTDVSQESSSQSADFEISSSVRQSSKNDSIKEGKTKPILSDTSQSAKLEEKTTVEVKEDSPKKSKTPDSKTEDNAGTASSTKVVKTKIVNANKIPVPKAKPPVVVKPKLFFPDTLFNFGFIDEGDTISHTFRFLNDGQQALEILDVQVSCGCMIPLYPLESIGPGRLGKIDVTFLSTGKIGSQVATIDVLTNAENPKQKLYLKGVVR